MQKITAHIKIDNISKKYIIENQRQLLLGWDNVQHPLRSFCAIQKVRDASNPDWKEVDILFLNPIEFIPNQNDIFYFTLGNRKIGYGKFIQELK